MTVKKSTALLFAALALIVLAVIYRFSSQPKNISREKSDGIAVVVENINQNIEKKKQDQVYDSETVNSVSGSKTNSGGCENATSTENASNTKMKESKTGIDFSKFVRKGAHIAEYAAFAVCFSLFFVLIDKTKITYLTVIATGLAYALFDEAHQFFIPGRTPKIKDILFDATGLVIGTALIYIAAAAVKARKNHRNAGYNSEKH